MGDSEPNLPHATGDDFYLRLFASAAVAMIATDREFRIISWNAAAEAVLGRPGGDMLGQPLSQAVPEHRRRLLERLLKRTRDRGEATQFEVRLPGPDGTYADLMVVLSPVHDTVGTVDGIAAWIVDESASKRMAERLNRSEKMAALGTLAGGVAHHFNNIFGGLATFVDYALTSNNPEAMKRALQMAAEASTRASRITQSLLGFAEHDSRTDDLSDLTEVVMTFAHLVERPLLDKHIALKMNLRPVPVVAVEGRMMHRVLQNLLANAEDAMPRGGTLTIGLEPRGKEVALTFADTGEGIRPEHQRLIFEPFFTTRGLHSGGDKDKPGLGLSVALGCIEEMGARIDVESDVGSGTRFLLSFPCAETSAGR